MGVPVGANHALPDAAVAACAYVAVEVLLLVDDATRLRGNDGL